MPQRHPDWETHVLAMGRHKFTLAPAGREGWPLVLWSHGLYGCAAGYSGVCAELASHGAVVVAGWRG